MSSKKRDQGKGSIKSGFKNVVREAGNVLLDFVGVFFPNETNKVQNLLNKDAKEALQYAYNRALTLKGQLDQNEAARLDKYMSDMTLWMQKLSNTGSRHVHKAYGKKIRNARKQDEQAREEYNKKAVDASVDIEVLSDIKNRPEAYVVGNKLPNDINDVMQKYNKTAGINSN